MLQTDDEVTGLPVESSSSATIFAGPAVVPVEVTLL